MNENIKSFETVKLDDKSGSLVIIDQTKLPNSTEFLYLNDLESIWDAIYLLKVRGAPAIGVAAAIGIYLIANDIQTNNYNDFYAQFLKAKDYLNSARPTAVNLSWALDRMDKVIKNNNCKSVNEIKKLLRDEALTIKHEDTWVCKKIGEFALTLLKPNMGLLTHCNAGQLATSKYGTATAAMYLGQENGYNFKVYCDETRPLLQGARLTAYELSESGIDTTLICDNMAPYVMNEGLIDACFVGCDRVAANGDTANKIGTSGVAIDAKYYKIPFYVCAPTSTIDLKCESGKDINIEQRAAEEVTEMWYKQRVAPKKIKVLNPAFDITKAANITAIITEYGICYPPYEISIKEIFEVKNNNRH